MAGKTTLRGEVEEGLLQGQCILSNFAQGLENILDTLEANEKLDHENDRIRNQAVGFLLKSLECYNAKDYEGMQKNLHAGIQKLHEQEALDYRDDKPRVDVRLKLTELRLNALYGAEDLRKITGITGGIDGKGK